MMIYIQIIKNPFVFISKLMIAIDFNKEIYAELY